MKRLNFVWSLALCISCTHPQIVLHTSVPPVVNTGCDSINVKYGTDIKPILRDNCYECHATAVTTTGGLDLENFTSLKLYLNNGFRGDGVYGSKLYHCISHSPLALPMPPTYVLDTCSLRKIDRWIKLGAPES
jgi:hypothetical protein